MSLQDYRWRLQRRWTKSIYYKCERWPGGYHAQVEKEMSVKPKRWQTFILAALSWFDSYGRLACTANREKRAAPDVR